MTGLETIAGFWASRDEDSLEEELELEVGGMRTCADDESVSTNSVKRTTGGFGTAGVFEGIAESVGAKGTGPGTRLELDDMRK